MGRPTSLLLVVALVGAAADKSCDANEVDVAAKVVLKDAVPTESLEETTAMKPLPDCKDNTDQCSVWAAAGECEANPRYMLVECSASCKSCHIRDPKMRCVKDPMVQPAITGLAGDSINALFERATSSEWDRYRPTVHSRDPWVVTYEDFLSEAETAALLAALGSRELERSANVGGMDTKGKTLKSLDNRRTSTNAWCDAECASKEDVRVVQWRIGNLTGITEAQSEYLQLLRYEPGQYYRSHHDFNPQHLLYPMGPRLLTLFLYLSDVEEGGETAFPALNIIVAPKRGRALLWPSVTETNILQPDMRTKHKARTVKTGIKYAANAWLHQYDFRTPHALGCAP